MSILAEGNITLTAVNDASSVLLTPGSCMIKADYDGSNPVLTNAYGDISLIRGENKVSLAGATVTVQSTSDPGITAQILNIDAYTKRVKITALATTILSGNIVVSVVTASLSATVTFQFFVIREATMLDWIQDWETNKTSISGGYILTPKIYAGAIDSEGKLTGVYMGPDTNGAGLYGYRGGDEVFHLNATGAMLGGWNLNTGGISSSDGKMKILSEGTIAAYDANDNVVWGLYKTGAASFAKGNVLFNADGSASFTGSITSESGTIGGWGITSRALWKNHVMLDASRNYIGISKTAISAANAADSNYANRDTVHSGGGVCMFYTSDNGYGLEGYLSSGTAIFQLGSTNQIANWTLKANSLASDYVVLSNLGTNAGIFLSTSSMASSALTGLATTIQGGTGIYIQATASAVDMAGYISGSLRFRVGTVQNYIAGWSFDASSLRNRYISISNDSSNSGIYFTTSDTSANTIAQLPGQIQGGTGIYIKSGASSVELAGYASGSVCFKLGTAGNVIAGWNFNSTSIYTGGNTITNGFTIASGSVVMKTDGLYGFKWNILADGSAKFANGKASFAADGSGSLAGGKITWAYANNKTTVSIGSVMIIDDDITADGVVLSKSIMVRNSSNSIMAGMTAEGTTDSSVRFWAGGSYANRASASTKFRVTQGGKLYASDAEITGKIEASSGNIGLYNIDANGLYYGDISQWAVSSYKQDLAYLVPGAIRLQTQVGYFSAGDIANMKIALGKNSDPDASNANRYCDCAAYIYRQMNAYDNEYYPAVKIISDNVINRDVALLTKGAIVCKGGLIASGYFMQDSITQIDLAFGTTIVVQNNTFKWVYLPNLNMMKKILCDNSSSFVIPIIIIASKSSSEHFYLGFYNSSTSSASTVASNFIDFNGNNYGDHIEMGAGDIAHLALIYDGSKLYAQIIDRNY